MADTTAARVPAGYVPPPRGGRYENVVLTVLFATFGSSSHREHR